MTIVELQNLGVQTQRQQEDDGYIAYHQGIHRDALLSDAERAGWDDARGEWLYHLAMLERHAEIDAAQGEYSDWRWA